jgi:allose kinase
MPACGPVTIVVEIGGTSVKIGFAEGARPHGFTRTSPTAGIRVADPIAALAALIGSASAEAGLSPGRVVATVPGFIDLDRDRVLAAANVPELNGRRLATELSAALGLDVVLERDVVLQLLGECRNGVAVGETHVLAVYFGTGIGAAYLADGSIFRGGGWAMELGHAPVHGQGRSLPGLRADSLEVYASGRTLSALAQAHGLPVGSLFSAAGPDLRAALDALVRDQAFAVATAIALLSPRVVVIGGGVVDMVDYPRNALAAAIAAHLPLPQSIRPLDLRWATLGWQAAIWGAIALG